MFYIMFKYTDTVLLFVEGGGDAIEPQGLKVDLLPHQRVCYVYLNIGTKFIFLYRH